MNHQDIIIEDVKEIIDSVGPKSFEKLSNKNVLITGANGLLASYIVDTLIYLNDNFDLNCTMICPIRSPLKDKDRLGYLLNKNRKDIVFIQHDAIRPLKRDIHVDFIVHAAGKSTPKLFVNDPICTIDINTTALRWLLDLAVKDKVESFVYYSSGEIYGNPTEIPTPETCSGNTTTTSPRSCYSESKRCGEALCLAFYNMYSVPIKILRPSIIYGPGISIYDSKLLSDFIRCAIFDGNIKMLNNGERIRNFCYISDATIMFWKIFLSEKNGEIFNIGHYDDGISIRELARIILKLCGKNSENIDVQKDLNYSESSPFKVYLDMNKVYSIFGFKAKTKLEDGLKRTIDWNRSKYKI